MTDDGLGVADNRVISNQELNEWANKLRSIDNLTKAQGTVIHNFIESCVRLVGRRAELHLISLQFYEVVRLNRTVADVQEDFYYRTEIFFQGYYGCLSQLANMAHHFSLSSSGISVSSNAKFLKTVAAKYQEVAPCCAVLEEAREHRAFLDHPASNQIYDWMTLNTADERVLQIWHYGMYGPKGVMPKGAKKAPKSGVRLPVEADWFKITPNHFLVEGNLKILIDFMVVALISSSRADIPQEKRNV